MVILYYYNGKYNRSYCKWIDDAIRGYIYKYDLTIPSWRLVMLGCKDSCPIPITSIWEHIETFAAESAEYRYKISFNIDTYYGGLSDIQPSTDLTPEELCDHYGITESELDNRVETSVPYTYTIKCKGKLTKKCLRELLDLCNSTKITDVSLVEEIKYVPSVGEYDSSDEYDSDDSY
jgi:hypothetical protein